MADTSVVCPVCNNFVQYQSQVGENYKVCKTCGQSWKEDRVVIHSSYSSPSAVQSLQTSSKEEERRAERLSYEETLIRFPQYKCPECKKNSIRAYINKNNMYAYICVNCHKMVKIDVKVE